MDFYAGFGIRNISSRIVGQDFDPNNSLTMPFNDPIESIRFEQELKGGITTLVNFTTGLRICYKF